LERFRNVEYMENELETYNREEEEKLKESEKLLKHMQSRIREEEMTMLREGKASSLGHRNDSLDDSGIYSIPLPSSLPLRNPRRRDDLMRGYTRGKDLWPRIPPFLSSSPPFPLLLFPLFRYS
jgi:hypothetical protein